jgi:hypothetical protein
MTSRSLLNRRVLCGLCLGTVVLGLACGGTQTSAHSTRPPGLAVSPWQGNIPVDVPPPAGSDAQLSYPRGCSATAECEVGWLPLDCCGSMRAVGVRGDAREALEREAHDARPFAASCECLAAPTLLDSGQTADSAVDVVVECESHTCATKLRAPAPPPGARPPGSAESRHPARTPHVSARRAQTPRSMWTRRAGFVRFARLAE